MKYEYDYPMPSVTADLVIETTDKKILLIKRGKEPFKNHYALPGGFLDVNSDKDVQHTAERELYEETGLTKVSLFQFGTYGKIGRDPRGRVITVVFGGFLSKDSKDIPLKAGDDAQSAEWISFDSLMGLDLAFDHKEILEEYFGLQGRE